MGAARYEQGGFTLVEVLAAVAILGGALFILLNGHYSALKLYESMTEEVTNRELLERVVDNAEFEVLSGTLSDSGEFEGRYAGYTWAFEGETTGGSADTPIPFYQVSATLKPPEGDEQTMTFYVFNTSSNEVLKGKGSTK